MGWIRHASGKAVDGSEHALENDGRALHDLPAKLNQLAGMAALQ